MNPTEEYRFLEIILKVNSDTGGALGAYPKKILGKLSRGLLTFENHIKE